MSAFDVAGARTGEPRGHSHDLKKWPVLVGAWCLISIASAMAQTAAPLAIVEPTGDLTPAYSKEMESSAQQLIETWRSSNLSLEDKRVDTERFEIVARRVVSGKISRAFLQFRVLPPQGDAMAFAGARCPGRKRPVEIQVFYQWSDFLGAWVPHNTRGEGDDDLCSNDKLWTSDQIERLVDPPPLPVPPKVSRADVVTPRVGSAERAAILNALRPRYEDLFGRSIVFKVETLRVAAGFAFVVVHPKRPNGASIEKSKWKKALDGECFQDPLGATHEYWLTKASNGWEIGVKNDMCADDSISDQGDLIGAPPQLAGMDAWPQREFMPDPD
jgi:hypothetical protein